MVAPKTRVMVALPSHREVMDKVKVEVLRLIAEKVLEFQEEQFRAWFGESWQRLKDARDIIRCQRFTENTNWPTAKSAESLVLDKSGGLVAKFSDGL